MKVKVTLDDQPLAFIRSQAPETRRALRDALHGVEKGERHPEPLEAELAGFFKLKVGGHRMILQSVASETGPALRVIFAEKREAVYALFSQLLGLE